MKCYHPFTREIAGKAFEFPCGKCLICKARHRNMWAYRLNVELQHSTTAHFMTLTYNDEKVPFHVDGDEPVWMAVNKRDCQLFIKRLRQFWRDRGLIVNQRHFLTAEYGESTWRPHYHAIMFNLPDMSLWQLEDIIASKWQQGDVQLSLISDGRIKYAAKYEMMESIYPKLLTDDDNFKTFKLISDRPPIGHQALNNPTLRRQIEEQGITYTRDINGYPTPLPRIYTDKLLSFDEKKSRLNYFHQKNQHEKEFEFNQWCKDNIDVIRQRMLREQRLSGRPVTFKTTSKVVYKEYMQEQEKLALNTIKSKLIKSQTL